MGNEATLQQIIAEIEARKKNPKPWDAPPQVTPVVAEPPSTLPPSTLPPARTMPAPTDPNEAVRLLMQRNKEVAPLGAEGGMVGNEGQGISAQDANLIKRLMQMLGL